MRQLIFFFLLSCFSISGCAFLRGGDDLTLEDSYEDEETDEENEFNLEEDEDGEFVAEDEEEDDEAEEQEEGGGLRGFFSRLFGSSDEEDEDSEFIGEDEDFAEGDRDYEDYEEEESEDYSAGYEEEVDPEDQKISTPEESPELVASISNGKTETSELQSNFIPLRKIISVPYKKAGYLVNAVYIARPGDTLESISQKIYGSNQVTVLYAINPHLQSRSAKVGDKIYYNSPSRRNDSSKLLFYYQDINVPSSSYTLSQGDNIRQVAGQLLGHPNSWKEIWATNPELESKGEIKESISIVYWPKTVARVMRPESVVEEEGSLKGESLDQDQRPGQIQNETPFLEESFPPDPLAVDQISEPEKSKTVGILSMIFKQKEIVITLLGILLILILIIRLIVKKRKQRDFDYTATNIEV